MLLLAFALTAATVPPKYPFAPPASTSQCPRTSSYLALGRGKKLVPRTLDELPPANLYKAVYRRVNGCEAPIVVRYDIGRR